MNRFLSAKQLRQLTDPRNLAVYVFALIVLAIAWSGARTLQTNYGLQQKISTLRQENTVLQLQNDTTALQNQYFQTNDYLEIAARQDLGLAAPGEKVLLVPKSVALKYVDQSTIKKSATSTADNRSKYIRNLEAWRDFLLGRQALAQ